MSDGVELSVILATTAWIIVAAIIIADARMRDGASAYWQSEARDQRRRRHTSLGLMMLATTPMFALALAHYCHAIERHMP